MKFTKKICEEYIFFEPGDVPIHSTGEVFNTYPCVFNTVTFQLMMNPFMVELADAICFPDGNNEEVLYNFYISIKD